MNKIFIVISILMIAAGAVNHGVTKFWLAVPFMVYLVYASYRHNKLLVPVSLLYILLAISISLNRDKIPVLYPIIQGGEVIITQTGYLKTFKASNGQWKVNAIYSFLDEAAMRKILDGYAYDASVKIAIKNFIDNPLATSTVVANERQVWSEAEKFIRVQKGDTFEVLKMKHTTGWEWNFIGPFPAETFWLYTDDLIFSVSNNYTDYGYGYESRMRNGTYGLSKDGNYNSYFTFNKGIVSGWSMWLSDKMFSYLLPIVLLTLWVRLMIRKSRRKSLNQIT